MPLITSIVLHQCAFLFLSTSTATDKTISSLKTTRRLFNYPPSTAEKQQLGGRQATGERLELWADEPSIAEIRFCTESVDEYCV